MARRRKEVVNDHEKAVQAFIERNFKDGQIMATQPNFGWEYRFPDGSIHVFTEEVLEGVLATGRVRLVSRFPKFVNLMGQL